jgi:hypothetical protein
VHFKDVLLRQLPSDRHFMEKQTPSFMSALTLYNETANVRTISSIEWCCPLQLQDLVSRPRPFHSIQSSSCLKDFQIVRNQAKQFVSALLMMIHLTWGSCPIFFEFGVNKVTWENRDRATLLQWLKDHLERIWQHREMWIRVVIRPHMP